MGGLIGIRMRIRGAGNERWIRTVPEEAGDKGCEQGHEEGLHLERRRAGGPGADGGFDGRWNERGVRSEIVELFEGCGTGGRCCGWSATQPRSGGGFLRVDYELQLRLLPSAFRGRGPGGPEPALAPASNLEFSVGFC